jgi:hypothetical protein
VVLFGSSYWQGLLDWLRASALEHGAVSEKDIDMLQITDSIDEAVATMLSHQSVPGAATFPE